MRTALFLLALPVLAACSSDYSPDTYASNAVQQANKVEQGVVAGVREVSVSAAGTVGAVAGGAAGGIAGSEVGGGTVSKALGTLGGTLVGGLIGTGVEKTAGEARAFEYVVRKTNGELVSVTQHDPAPLAIGQHVLVIAGNQARVVPDYTVPTDPPKPPAPPPPPPPSPSPSPAAAPAPAQPPPATP